MEDKKPTLKELQEILDGPPGTITVLRNGEIRVVHDEKEPLKFACPPGGHEFAPLSPDHNPVGYVRILCPRCGALFEISPRRIEL